MTYTYAVLEVSKAAYDEIAAGLKEAGYGHAFHSDSGGPVIDMHGIALSAKSEPEPTLKPDPYLAGITERNRG